MAKIGHAPLEGPVPASEPSQALESGVRRRETQEVVKRRHRQADSG